MLCHWAAWGPRARPPRTPAVSACTRDCVKDPYPHPLPTLPIRRRSYRSRATSRCSSSARSSACRSRRSRTSSSSSSPRPSSTCSTPCPSELGFDGQPAWWPIPLLALSGLARRPRRSATSRERRPQAGRGLQDRAEPCARSSFPGIILAAFATLSLGVVLGPEAPLIAIGSGMGVLAVHLIKRDAPAMASVVIGAAGQLRRDRHPARLAARRRVPADGGRSGSAAR